MKAYCDMKVSCHSHDNCLSTILIVDLQIGPYTRPGVT